MKKFIRLTGAAPNSDGEPWWVPVDDIGTMGSIIQRRPQAPPRRVTEIWLCGMYSKFFQESLDYIRKYYQAALDEPQKEGPGVQEIMPPQAIEFLRIAHQTPLPADAPPPQREKTGWFIGRKRQ